MPINAGPSMGQSIMPGGPQPRKRPQFKPQRGMVSSHGPGSGAPPTARRQPRMVSSSGGNTPGNLPSGGGGMMDPNFRNMMNFKSAGGMGSQFAKPGITTYGAGSFGVSPEIYNQNFGQGGMPLLPQQQDMGGSMAAGGFMGGQGIDTGPSMDRMYDMSQMNPNAGFAGGMNQLQQNLSPMQGGMWGNIFNRMQQGGGGGFGGMSPFWNMYRGMF